MHACFALLLAVSLAQSEERISGPNEGAPAPDYGRYTEFGNADDSISESFSFPEQPRERPAKVEDKPVRTVLVGGLASFELNRPRWKETTFDDRPEYGFLDNVNFALLTGGAWIVVRVQEAEGDAAAELNRLQHELASRLQKAKATPITVKGPKGQVPAVELTGEAVKIPRVLRAAAFVEDGIAVQIWLECVASRKEVTQRDWEQLIGSFRLQSKSKPDEPLAFAFRSYAFKQPSDPALAVFLPKATRLVPNLRPHQVIAISPDGMQALMQLPEGVFLENLATAKREPFALTPMPHRPFAWSKDGKRLAYATETEIVVAELDGKIIQKIEAIADHLAFGPGEDELLACISTAMQPRPYFPATRFHSTRLEKIKLSDGGRHPLIDFPLSKVKRSAVSPDGKWIAVVTNRDTPRTDLMGGHLYICAADGTGLRQITKDPEDISAVAWSADGKSILLVRRLVVGEKGAVGVLGGSADLYRVSPETGQAVNLTRSGRIGRIWVSGPEVAFEINAWDIDAAQQGIFSIKVDHLQKATASRPVPPLANPRAQAKAVADKVRAALAPTPLPEVVPTPELMEKTAKAFAEAVQETCGRSLDFSPASLDRLGDLIRELDLSSGREPALVFGFGAYYGETLRKSAGAEWKLKPVPFGEWGPGRGVADNPLVEVVLPLSDPYRWALNSEEGYLRRAEDLSKRDQGRKMVLVYPPAHAEDALREASPPDYLQAMKLLDAGEVKPALDILLREAKRRPKNGPLAQEIVAICQASRRPDLAKELVQQVVEAGSEVPDLLIAHADELAPTNPKKALEYYRKAVEADWPSAEAYIKLGRRYAAMGQRDFAECCWRRAYLQSTTMQQVEIRKLLGLDEKPENPPEEKEEGEGKGD